MRRSAGSTRSALSIDAFSPKNRAMDEASGDSILIAAGLRSGRTGHAGLPV